MSEVQIGKPVRIKPTADHILAGRVGTFLGEDMLSALVEIDGETYSARMSDLEPVPFVVRIVANILAS